MDGTGKAISAQRQCSTYRRAKCESGVTFWSRRFRCIKSAADMKMTIYDGSVFAQYSSQKAEMRRKWEEIL